MEPIAESENSTISFTNKKKIKKIFDVSLCNDPPASNRLSDCPSITTLNMDNISGTIHSRVIKLGTKVLCEKTFKIKCHTLTLT